MWSRWSGGVIAAMVAIALCAGFAVKVVDAPHSFPSRVNPQPTGSSVVPGRTLRAALAAAVTFDPKPGAVDVALDGRVVVNANAGRLTSVRAVTTSKWPLFGTLSASGKRWQSNGPLVPGISYQVTATVSGSAGVAANATSTFRTVTPVATVTATVFPDGLTVGVAQPIVIRFNHFITTEAARTAVLERFTVTESRPVPGGWHWFNNRELHLRPQVFWPVGEKVTVTSDLNGWNAGNGMWGEGTSRAQFTIGNAHVAVANLATHQMTVSDNGRLMATYPFSGGRDMYPTMNGVHIVLDRESVVHMVSSTNGIPVNSPDGYDELVYSDVHITDSGEYVHAAPWSVNSQGRDNVSHGCINLSPADAFAFFGFSRVGDVVWVVGGPRPPAQGDHGVMDWETKWSDWTPAVVHNMFPPPAAKPRAPARAAPRSGERR
jgi:lipoprotein-anchoring transpeptidase ErfK/SrfK